MQDLTSAWSKLHSKRQPKIADKEFLKFMYPDAQRAKQELQNEYKEFLKSQTDTVAAFDRSKANSESVFAQADRLSRRLVRVEKKTDDLSKEKHAFCVALERQMKNDPLYEE